MDDSQLLSLWQRGLRIAERRCAHTLARLHAGDGGFYEADDFVQDLFLVFRELAERWQAQGAADEEALWAAWQRRLWHGGQRVLRRAPQRLWRRNDVSFAPDELEDAPDNISDGLARLLRAIGHVLVQPEDAEAAQVRAETASSLEQTLHKLRTAHRCRPRLVVVAEEPATPMAPRERCSCKRATSVPPVAPCRRRRGQQDIPETWDPVPPHNRPRQGNDVIGTR